MHELSVATALVESLLDYGREHNVKVVCAHVKVGLLSGIDPEALEFAWLPALENFADSGLKDCRLKIKRCLLKHQCSACKKEFEFEDWRIECPECKTESLRRTGGNEFLLESIEVENV